MSEKDEKGEIPPVEIYEDRGAWGCKIYLPGSLVYIYPCRTASEAMIVTVQIIEDEIRKRKKREG